MADINMTYQTPGQMASDFPEFGGGGGGSDVASGGSSSGGFFSNPSNIYSLINAAIGAFASTRQAGAQNELFGMSEERLKAARAAAGVENFASIVSRLQPLFRELVAGGLGPKFTQDVASSLAKRGLIGSGVGAALKNAAFAAPELFALQSAAGEAGRIQGGQVSAELGAPLPSQARVDPFSNALLSGARAFFATSAPRTAPQSQANELFPGLTPEDEKRRY